LRRALDQHVITRYAGAMSFSHPVSVVSEESLQVHHLLAPCGGSLLFGLLQRDDWSLRDAEIGECVVSVVRGVQSARIVIGITVAARATS
jgi:hypothetical protein